MKAKLTVKYTISVADILRRGGGGGGTHDKADMSKYYFDEYIHTVFYSWPPAVSASLKETREEDDTTLIIFTSTVSHSLRYRPFLVLVQ